MSPDADPKDEARLHELMANYRRAVEVSKDFIERLRARIRQAAQDPGHEEAVQGALSEIGRLFGRVLAGIGGHASSRAADRREGPQAPRDAAASERAAGASRESESDTAGEER